jgi:hypothetical protein
MAQLDPATSSIYIRCGLRAHITLQPQATLGMHPRGSVGLCHLAHDSGVGAESGQEHDGLVPPTKARYRTSLLVSVVKMHM